MLIDFERSQLLDTPQPMLAILEPNKGLRVQNSKGQTNSVGRSSSGDLPPQVQGGFLADLAGVKAAFYTLSSA